MLRPIIAVAVSPVSSVLSIFLFWVGAFIGGVPLHPEDLTALVPMIVFFYIFSLCFVLFIGIPLHLFLKYIKKNQIPFYILPGVFIPLVYQYVIWNDLSVNTIHCLSFGFTGLFVSTTFGSLINRASFLE